MPHKTNPCADHNPFECVSHVRDHEATESTSTPKPAGVPKSASSKTISRVNANLQSKFRKVERADKRKEDANAVRRKKLKTSQAEGRGSTAKARLAARDKPPRSSVRKPRR